MTRPRYIKGVRCQPCRRCKGVVLGGRVVHTWCERLEKLAARKALPPEGVPVDGLRK